MPCVPPVMTATRLDNTNLQPYGLVVEIPATAGRLGSACLLQFPEMSTIMLGVLGIDRFDRAKEAKITVRAAVRQHQPAHREFEEVLPPGSQKVFRTALRATIPVSGQSECKKLMTHLRILRRP